MHELSDAIPIHSKCFNIIRQKIPKDKTVYDVFCHKDADLDKVFEAARVYKLASLRSEFCDAIFDYEGFVRKHGENLLKNPESRLELVVDVLMAGYNSPK